MRLHWSSRRGRQRATNNDAVTIGRAGSLLACMLVDAANRSPMGARLARHWGHRVVTRVLETQCGQKEAEVLALLQEEQRGLRDDFLLDIASYCLLCLDTRTHELRTFHVGDCLAGEQRMDGVDWWTMPHTLTRESGFCDHSTRHCLTRSLNARRFCPPEVNARRMKPEGCVLIASDGWWAECQQEGRRFGETLDDASYLRIEASAAAFTHDSDTGNHYSITAAGTTA